MITTGLISNGGTEIAPLRSVFIEEEADVVGDAHKWEEEGLSSQFWITV